ncbi:MAG: ABC transporter permease [Gemmatimonadetes bacterium]|uniref:ABC transporter permease n=1 Tax=Candidatus Kutchimonas denitrificans TaxID=3056748 RepID=A0AAE4Z7V7_9BACT|nr:ABC transporter permease [Gemmatimonadota bacterium]NIR74092.1 ABC transporter permease [Candidatus Kutchimonas denitrificans]NIS01654.1 ABC transporter permease [Gemmatimonadota bacterium]NIT67392.1 ABC transporter permease [Gemmatimonadota bacterium]NIU52755.1 FtsX-like permease family protein [Gemmatimonadota bacterium]
MESLLADARFALRTLIRRPGFSGLVVLTIALGIGANTAMFSVVSGTLLRPLPYLEPDQVVLIRPLWRDGRRSSGHVGVAEYNELRRRNRSFTELAAVEIAEATLVGSGPPQEIVGARVTSSLFDVLGVGASRGRTLLSQDDAAVGADVVVVSHSLWQRAFGGDPDLLGRTIRLDQKPYTVVGIMPDGFVLPTEIRTLTRADVLMPLRFDPSRARSFAIKDLESVIGRLAPRATIGSAAADVERIATEIADEHPENYAEGGWTLDVVRPLDEAVGGVRELLILLVVGVGLVLLVGCANVAGLMLTRGAGRRRELAVRAAVGAGRGRLVRHLLTESVLLVGSGGVLGAAAAFVVVPTVRRTLFESLPRAEGIAVDPTVLLFALGVTGVTGILVGLVPAWRLSGLDLRGHLVGAGTGAGRTWSRKTGRALVVGELAVTTILVIGSMLMTRSLIELWRVDPGFESTGVLTFQVSTPRHAYPDETRVNEFHRRLVGELEAVPGVQAAGIMRRRPLADRVGTWSVMLQGRDGPAWRPEGYPEWQAVSPGVFEALEIRISRGRGLEPTDLSGPAGPILVNEAFARAYWPGEDPVGGRVRMDGGPNNPWLTIVGVVEDVSHDALAGGANPRLYIPHPHFAEATSMGPIRGVSLVLKTTLAPGALADEARSAVWSLDPEMPVTSVRTMREIVAASVSNVSLLALLLNVFGGLALVMAAVGIYGLMSQEVSSRTHEIGVRTALGADPGRTLRLFLLEGLGLGVVGVAAGSFAALAASRVLATFVFGVTPSDPVTYAGVAVALCCAAGLASYIPARRAIRVDPIVALRPE